MKQFIFLILSLLVRGVISAQELDSVEYLKNYNERIKLDRINDIYIPENTEDAINELFRLTDPEGRNKLIQAPEDTIASKLHFSLGRWIQINWGFDDGSRLSHYYKLKGLSYTDDKIDLLIRAFYRKLKNAPINEAELIKNYKLSRKKEHEKKMKKSKTLSTKKNYKPKN